MRAAGMAHLGSGAPRLPDTFGGWAGGNGGAVIYLSPAANWANLGTDLSVWVDPPTGAPSNAIMAAIFAQHPTEDWLESPWVTLPAGRRARLATRSGRSTSAPALTR